MPGLRVSHLAVSAQNGVRDAQGAGVEVRVHGDETAVGTVPFRCSSCNLVVSTSGHTRLFSRNKRSFTSESSIYLETASIIMNGIMPLRPIAPDPSDEAAWMTGGTCFMCSRHM